VPVYKKVKKRTNKGYELLIYPNGSKYWYLNGINVPEKKI